MITASRDIQRPTSAEVFSLERRSFARASDDAATTAEVIQWRPRGVEAESDAGWPELIPALRRRASQGTMPRAQFDAVLALWTLARERVPNLRKPGAGPAEDGTYYLAWSFSDVATVVTVEVSPSGVCDWFIGGRDDSSSGDGTPGQAVDAVAASLPTNAP